MDTSHFSMPNCASLWDIITMSAVFLSRREVIQTGGFVSQVNLYMERRRISLSKMALAASRINLCFLVRLSPRGRAPLTSQLYKGFFLCHRSKMEFILIIARWRCQGCILQERKLSYLSSLALSDGPCPATLSIHACWRES